MKSFYSWYRKHITGAIFTGLILGILTGLFLAGRFEPCPHCDQSDRKYLHERPEHDDLSHGLLFHCHWDLFHRNARTTADHCSIHDLFSLHNGTCQPVRTDHPETDPSRRGSQI